MDVAFLFFFFLKYTFDNIQPMTHIKTLKFVMYIHKIHGVCGWSHMIRSTTEVTRWPVHPGTISTGIHPVWSETLLRMLWVANDPYLLQADSEYTQFRLGGCPGSLGAQVISLVLLRALAHLSWAASLPGLVVRGGTCWSDASQCARTLCNADFVNLVLELVLPEYADLALRDDPEKLHFLILLSSLNICKAVHRPDKKC